MPKSISSAGAIAGLLVALWAFLPPPDMKPAPLSLALLALGILGIGGAFYLYVEKLSHHVAAPASSPVHDIALFLQFSDDHTVPVEIRQTNVMSWYALYTESITVTLTDENKQPKEGFSVPPRWTVFLVFKDPATYRQMLAKCGGTNAPKCAVQFSNDRYAIVTLTGSVAGTTLDISTVR